MRRRTSSSHHCSIAARQASASSPLYGDDIHKLWPISYEGQSDTACFDNALEFLVQGGYPLAHAVMMMIPEAWAGNPLMDEQRRAFYEYNAALMEPWDGPAAIAFTDGRQIGATLDRNGLRPARYLVTSDDRIVMASEMGVLKIPEEQLECELQFGYLDPLDELVGTQARLQNLGYYHGELDGETNDEFQGGLQAFQSDFGLPVTGELDDATKQKLFDEHDEEHDYPASSEAPREPWTWAM